MRENVVRLERACPFGKCDGSGWLVGKDDRAYKCDCHDRLASQRRSRGVTSEIPKRYRGVGFDRPPISNIDATVVGVVRDYVDSLEENLANGRGLWLMGPVGTGKTSLAMLISKSAIEAGRTVRVDSLPRLLSRIRRTYDSTDGSDSYLDYFNRLINVDLLHIDDLGAEKRTDWVIEQLYAIINERYVMERPVLVTTNLDQPQLEEQIGARTVSRLVEICGDPLPMFGEDHRYRLEAS